MFFLLWALCRLMRRHSETLSPSISHLDMFGKIALTGLDQERVIDSIAPVLRAHGVEGVELLWRTDSRGRVLYLTVERPGSSEPGAGITLDLCSEISRDLSTALDVADVINSAYRLEVGSPGLERALYTKSDYERFAGQSAKVKLTVPVEGQTTLRGNLLGSDEQGRVLLDTDFGEFALDFATIQSGQLVFDWHSKSQSKGTKRVNGSARAASHGSNSHGSKRRRARSTQRSR